MQRTILSGALRTSSYLHGRDSTCTLGGEPGFGSSTDHTAPESRPLRKTRQPPTCYGAHCQSAPAAAFPVGRQRWVHPGTSPTAGVLSHRHLRNPPVNGGGEQSNCLPESSPPPWGQHSQNVPVLRDKSSWNTSITSCGQMLQAWSVATI